MIATSIRLRNWEFFSRLVLPLRGVGLPAARARPAYVAADDLGAFQRVAARAKLVTYGGDGYQYGLVASGSLDVVVESGLKIHDFASHVPVIEGAGGVVTDWSGRPLGPTSAGDVVAAGDARVHAEVLAALRRPG